MNPNSVNVHFAIRKDKIRNGKAPIYCRITVNSKRVNFSTKRWVAPGAWRKQTGSISGTSKEARELNSFLQDIETDILVIYQELRRTKGVITAQNIKHKYFNLDQDGTQEKGIVEMMDYHNKKNSGTLKWGTLKNYFTTRNYLSDFISKTYKANDIPLSQLAFKHLNEFEMYLRTTEPDASHNRMGNNTVMKHIERLRKVVNFCLKLDLLEKDPFHAFTRKMVKTHREILTPEELLEIQTVKLNVDRLKRVQTLFLFCCYTGLAPIDVQNLKWKHINLGINGKFWISASRTKTDELYKVPLLPFAEEIINTQRNQVKTDLEDFVFSRISNQKMNAYLKEILKQTSINKRVTFYVARHTFATTVTLANGVPLESISKMLGHTKFTTTQIYAKVLDSKVGADMETLGEILNQKASEAINAKVG